MRVAQIVLSCYEFTLIKRDVMIYMISSAIEAKHLFLWMRLTVNM